MIIQLFSVIKFLHMQHFIQVTLNTFQSKALTNYKIVIFPSANDEEYKIKQKKLWKVHRVLSLEKYNKCHIKIVYASSKYNKSHKIIA